MSSMVAIQQFNNKKDYKPFYRFATPQKVGKEESPGNTEQPHHLTDGLSFIKKWEIDSAAENNRPEQSG